MSQARPHTIERIRKHLAGADEGWLFSQIAAQVSQRRRQPAPPQPHPAELCETTQSAIPRLESGGRPPRIDTLLRIAHALDCELVVELRPRTRAGATKLPT